MDGTNEIETLSLQCSQNDMKIGKKNINDSLLKEKNVGKKFKKNSIFKSNHNKQHKLHLPISF